jgi:hypothetical protein
MGRKGIHPFFLYSSNTLIRSITVFFFPCARRHPVPFLPPSSLCSEHLAGGQGRCSRSLDAAVNAALRADRISGIHQHVLGNGVGKDDDRCARAMRPLADDTELFNAQKIHHVVNHKDNPPRKPEKEEKTRRRKKQEEKKNKKSKGTKVN